MKRKRIRITYASNRQVYKPDMPVGLSRKAGATKWDLQWHHEIIIYTWLCRNISFVFNLQYNIWLWHGKKKESFLAKKEIQQLNS